MIISFKNFKTDRSLIRDTRALFIHDKWRICYVSSL